MQTIIDGATAGEQKLNGAAPISLHGGGPAIIEGAYVRDLLAQPDVLQDVIAKLAATPFDRALTAGLRSGKYRRVVLTGMGSSLHANYPLHRALSIAGIPSYWVESAELLLGFDALYSPQSLLVGVSQSGESAEQGPDESP